MQRALAALLITAGLAVAAWATIDSTGDDVGALTVSEPAGPTPTPTSSETPTAASPSPSAAATPDPAAPEVARSSARIQDVDLSGPPAPRRISLPSIGVDAAVAPVGTDADGSMTIPEDVATVGWYRWGSAPASEDGTTVLSGHVDSRTQGRGAFFDLRALAVGDEVTITDQDGTDTTWRVVGRRTFEKASLPIEDLFRRDGAPRLVLITCGGEFDREARSYDSNVVVEAEPVA